MMGLAGLHDWMQRHQVLIVLLALVLLGVSLASIQRYSDRDRDKRRVVRAIWFYDLNTGDLFEAHPHALPPIDAPSGSLPDGQPAGVRAHVYACGDCERNQQFIGYLTTFTPEARQIMRSQRRDGEGGMNATQYAAMETALNEGYLMRREVGPWIRVNSTDADALISSITLRCSSGQPARECYPTPAPPPHASDASGR